MLARIAATGEERLQRLRRELDDPIAVDPPGPPPLELRPLRLNMQSFTTGRPFRLARRFRVHDDVRDLGRLEPNAGLDLAAARECASSSLVVGSSASVR